MNLIQTADIFLLYYVLNSVYLYYLKLLFLHRLANIRPFVNKFVNKTKTNELITKLITKTNYQNGPKMIIRGPKRPKGNGIEPKETKMEENSDRIKEIFLWNNLWVSGGGARGSKCPLDFANIGHNTNIFVTILTFCRNTITNIFKLWTFCKHGCFQPDPRQNVHRQNVQRQMVHEKMVHDK